MGLFAKTGSNTWSTGKKIYAKTAASTWSVANAVYAKIATGWVKMWPGDTPGSLSSDPINIRLTSYSGTVALSPQYIDTVLYGHDGDFTGKPIISITNRQLLSSTTTSLTGIINTPLETGAITDVLDLSNNSAVSRALIDGNYLFYQLTAENAYGPSVLNSPPIKIIKRTPSITSTIFTEDGTGVYQMEFYAASKWYNSPDLANSYVRWWKHTDKVNYRNGTILQTDYLNGSGIQKFGTGWTDGSATSPDLDGISIYSTANVPPSGTYIIAEVVLKNSYTTNFNTEVLAVKTSGVLPLIRNVRLEDDNGRDPTDYLNRLITDGFWYLKFDVDNVTASTTYRVDYRLYDVQLGVYYNFTTGASFTNGNSWPTQYNVTGSISGTTAYLNDGRRFINTSYLPAASHTYGGGLVRYRLGIRITAQTPGQQRTYFSGVINNNGGPGVLADTGGEFDLNTESVITLAASKTTPAVSESITFSGTTASYPSGYNSYPRQWKIDFGDGTDSGWNNFNGTANPSFSTTKSYSAGGTYAATLYWTPQGDKSRSTSTQITITVTNPPVNTSAPTLTGTNLSPGGVLDFSVGSWTNSPTSYTVRIYRGTASVATSETLVSTQTITAPATTGTYTITQEDYTNTGISPVRRYLRVFVTANNGTPSAQVAGGEVGPVTPTIYTITWDKNDGTGTISTSTFSAGGSVTAPNPTRANYVLDRFTETTAGTYFYSVLGGGSWSPPSVSRTMYARWIYSPPSYTFAFGNKLSISTNGYISLGSSVSVTENSADAVTSTAGKVLAVLPLDMVQTSLYYWSDTSKYIVRWSGYQYGNAANTMTYEATFYAGQQYADIMIIDRFTFQSTAAAYMIDGVAVTSYPSTPIQSSKYRVYFNGTAPAVVAYTATSTSVMKRDTTKDTVDVGTTTLTTATNQTSFIAPHFPPFFPPFFPPHFPPFFPPYFPAAALPGVPTGVTATNDGTNTTISWNAVSGATSYDIWYQSGPTYSGTSRDFGPITGTSYVTPTSSLFYYFVRAVNATGNGSYSAGVLATAGSTPPFFPPYFPGIRGY